MDASAPPGGDGSRGRPFRELLPALLEAEAGPAVVHLSSGLYEGPFELPSRVSLVGHGAVVLYSEQRSAPLLKAKGGANLEGLMLQGGAVGLSVGGGEVALSEVKLSGFRQAGIAVEEGELRARGLEVSGTLSGTRGVSVGPLGSAQLGSSAFLGALGRAVEVRGGSAKLERCRFEGPAVGLHAVGGEAEVSDSSFSGGRGPALFAAKATLRVARTLVHGHEYGLQAGESARLEVSDFTSVRAERAAVALTGARGRMEDVLAIEAGSFGGVQLAEAEVQMRRLFVHRAVGQGLFSRGGKLWLAGAQVVAVRADGEGSHQSGGDGLRLHGGESRIEDVTVRDVDGAGLVALSAAVAAVREFDCERCRLGGVSADTGSSVDAVSLRVSESPSALVVGGEARVRVDQLTARGTSEVVWAECGQGVQVLIGRHQAEVPLRLGGCVGVWDSPGLPWPPPPP